MKYLNKLQIYLSNLAVWNQKLHNMHWNVEGKLFFQLHERTEAMYDEVFKQFDDVAEIIKIKGEMPLARMQDYLKLATLKEVESKKFTTDEVVDVIMADMTALNELAKEIREDADQAGDFTVVMMFEEFVANYEKTLWFLRALNG